MAVIGIRPDPVPAYNFLILMIDSGSQVTGGLSAVQKVALGGFRECSGLEMTMQPEDFREGGNNGRVLHFRSRVTWANIRLRRGVGFSDQLWDWHYSFASGKGKRRDGVIVLQNDLHIPVKAWAFSRGLPVKWSGPSFSALENQIAIEELEIAHEGLTMMSLGSAISSASASV